MKVKDDIPTFALGDFMQIHRQPSDSAFGYDNLDAAYRIPGFELYSSIGLVGSVGPLRSDFYRMSITCTGGLDMQIGLEHYQHQVRTVSFTYPNQLFAKTNIRSGTFGYYMLFSRSFLDELMPQLGFNEEFPFYAMSGVPVFRLNEQELERILALIKHIDGELRQTGVGKAKAVQMYLYLILLEARRSYERQKLVAGEFLDESSRLVSTFIRQVGLHYLALRQVADYADLLAVTPNHLNRVVKAITGKTASNTIRNMLLLEARAQLRYTEKTIAEIGYYIGFSDPGAFNRFFKTMTGKTPQNYRKMHD